MNTHLFKRLPGRNGPHLQAAQREAALRQRNTPVVLPLRSAAEARCAESEDHLPTLDRLVHPCLRPLWTAALAHGLIAAERKGVDRNISIGSHEGRRPEHCTTFRFESTPVRSRYMSGVNGSHLSKLLLPSPQHCSGARPV